MENIINGRQIADELLEEVSKEVEELKSKNIIPKIVVILVGDNPASLSYIKQKRKACEKTGIEWEQINMQPSITTEQLKEKVEELNNRADVHGILAQLPLPDHIYEPDIIRAINPKKDVDGFTAYNIGKMFLGTEFEHLAPCTPSGVIKMLEYHDVDVSGKNITVIGRSNIVGKPLATMLINRRATVTVCNSRTKDLAKFTHDADIVCVAVGKPNTLTANMVKEGVIVIDIGMNRLENGKLCGDADFENIAKKAKLITPVPKGVGPMTVACLMENVVKAAKRLNDIEI